MKPQTPLSKFPPGYRPDSDVSSPCLFDDVNCRDEYRACDNCPVYSDAGGTVDVPEKTGKKKREKVYAVTLTLEEVYAVTHFLLLVKENSLIVNDRIVENHTFRYAITQASYDAARSALDKFNNLGVTGAY